MNDNMNSIALNNIVSSYGWQTNNIVIIDNKLKISLKNEYGNLKTKEYLMSSEEAKKFVSFLAELDNCLSDSNNHLTIYFDYSCPYAMKIINNGEDITYKLYEYSSEAIARKKAELNDAVNQLENKYSKTIREIFYNEQKQSDGKDSYNLFGFNHGYETVNVGSLADCIKKVLEYGIDSSTVLALKKFYDDLLMGVFQYKERFYTIGNQFYDKQQCKQMDILKKIVEVGTDLLEKYKSMVGSNHLSLEEAKRIRNELIANINYKEIMNSDYQNFLDFNYNSPYYEEKNESTVFEDLISQQEKKLTIEEKDALILYKACYYKEINEIVRYLRSKNLDGVSVISKDDALYLKRIIDSGYQRYLKGVEADKKDLGDGEVYNYKFRLYQPRALSDFFGKYPNYTFPDETTYKKVIYNTIIQVASALKKCQLSDDIVVYRGIANKDSALVSDKGFISTSLSFNTAREFSTMNDRGYNATKQSRVYKIIIPKGSSVICYNDNLFKKDGSKGFNEPQQEILFDINNFDLIFLDSTYMGNEAYFDIYQLKPKALKQVHDENYGKSR